MQASFDYQRRIWITGATSGIGRALVELYISSGDKLIVTARNRDSLESIREKAPAQIEILAGDIALDSSTQHLTSGLKALTGYLDLVILNAGTCEYVEINSFDSALFQRVMDVNYVGMVRCIEASLDLLRKSESRPQIVGISSAAAITGLPRAEAYGSSKAAVDNMLQSLSLDLAPQNISVCIVHPGFVDTPLTRKNDFAMPFLMSPGEAANIIVRGINKRKKRIAFPRRLIWPLKIMSILPTPIREVIGSSMVRVPS